MSLPEGEIQCPICMEPQENAVECVKCKNNFCEKCAKQIKTCPTCKSCPFTKRINEAFRRLVERLRVPCEFCTLPVPKGELRIHMKNCEKRPKSVRSENASSELVIKKMRALTLQKIILTLFGKIFKVFRCQVRFPCSIKNLSTFDKY